MAKGTYIGVDDTARKIKRAYIGVDGVARKLKKIYIGDENGKARLVYTSHEHSYTQGSVYTYFDDTHHTVAMRCSCGDAYSVFLNHNWVDYDYSGGLGDEVYKQCTDCKAIKYDHTHNWVEQGGGSFKCSICGAIKSLG